MLNVRLCSKIKNYAPIMRKHNPGHPTHWNRDVNAARNIRNIFLHTNTYGERPDPFIRGTY